MFSGKGVFRMPEVEELRAERIGAKVAHQNCSVAVLWIDWYAYHLSRFRALCEHPRLKGAVVGLEMVGGEGVHRGLKFREELPAGVPVVTLFPEGNWRSVSAWKLCAAVWSQLSRQDPSTVLVPGYYNAPALTAALWAKVHRKLAVLMTESTADDHHRVWWKESLKSAAIRVLFDWAISGGKAHQRYLRRLKFDPRRIARFYDNVDNNFYREGVRACRMRSRSEDFGLPTNYFLYVGRLAEEKNIGLLLEAYLAYRRQGGTWSLVLVGDGPLKRNLLQVAEESGFSADIYFEGLKSSKDLLPYYAFSRCFVLPSKIEPWGLVVNEAMASGLPVVVSKTCGCAEDLVQEGENGYRFDPRNASELSNRLSSVEALGLNELKSLGGRSLEIISHYSPEAWAGEVARIASSRS